MNKPELQETKNLFREFTNKLVGSAPSIRSSLESDPLNSSCPKKIESLALEINGENECSSPDTENENGIINPKLIECSKPGEIHKNHKKKENHYNPFAIPPNWELALKHSKSRKATREFDEDEASDSKDEICPCCGYEVNRKQIGLCESTNKLNFLGAGYPLLFNYYLYCVMILTILFLSFGVYAIYSNYNGHFCIEEVTHHTETLTTETHALRRVLFNENNKIFRFLSTETSASTENTTKESTTTTHIVEKTCTIDWIMIISLANKLDNKEANYIQSYFAIVAEILIIIVLIYFRKHQRKINNDVDEETNTPADYTIIVSGIPLGLKNCQYESELKRIFEEDSKTLKKFSVEKVNLVFNTKEIEKLEHELKKIVNKKKKVLTELNFNVDNKEVTDLDFAFDKIEEKLEKIRNHMMKTYQSFAGIAFISFSIEDEKQEFIEKQKLSSIEKLKIMFSKNTTKIENDDRIYFRNSLLLIDEAPEPNDVNWEFIYASTNEKIKIRILMNCLFIILLAGCFVVIWIITYFQSLSLEHAYENKIENKPGADDEFSRVKSISIVISALIVVFNKFCLGKMVHILSDYEKYSNFTKLNVSFGTKLSIALFFNTALITLFVEMVTFDNYYGYGGMITTEHSIFILNAFLPPFVWLLDPWSIKKYFDKKFVMLKVKQSNNKVAMTQIEANDLMEDVKYNMAKRYAEIMKTMWFTFFYAPAIPIGILWSAIGILLYYCIDKYNLIRRRTVKENISMRLTINMIELLELSLIFFGFSCVLLEKELYHAVSTPSIIALVIPIVHFILPMEEINEKLFPLKSKNETATYHDSVLDFDTDYDRENPVTKIESINYFAEQRSRRTMLKSQSPAKIGNRIQNKN